jgi:hypothetical protein
VSLRILIDVGAKEQNIIPNPTQTLLFLTGNSPKRHFSGSFCLLGNEREKPDSVTFAGSWLPVVGS